MTSKLFLIGAMMLATMTVNAQNTSDCRCEEDFEWMRSTFEINDAGFGYLVERKGRAAYNLHNQMILEKVRAAQASSECIPLLREWLAFFRSGHIGIQLLRPDAPSTQNASQTLAQNTELEIWKGDIAAFEKEMAARQDAGYEGVWDLGSARIGLKAEGDGYVGFVTESSLNDWKLGQVRMKITRDGDGWQTTLFASATNKLVANGQPELIGNTYLRIENGQMFRRVSPAFPADPMVDHYIKSRQARTPYVEEMSPTTLYIRIPSFDNRQKPFIDQMIADNFDKLTSTENLIIDLRNNGGGWDVSYEGLLPFLYSGPVRTPGTLFLSTPLNIEKTLALLDIAELDEETKEEVAALAGEMKAHPGEFVLMGDDEIDIETLDIVYEFPRNIGIIINENCASTTEQFLLAAKQSLKVKLFGITTYGALDASNVRQVDSPDGRYRLSYTTSLSARIPGMAIDEIGLQPDFYLDKTIPDYLWVEFVDGVLNR